MALQHCEPLLPGFQADVPQIMIDHHLDEIGKRKLRSPVKRLLCFANIRLKSRNDELARQLEVLEQDNKDLHRQIDILRRANDHQLEVINRMELNQRTQNERIENLIGRVMELEVRLGNTPHLPI